MGVNEKLGIDIEVNVSDAAQKLNKFSDLLQQLSSKQAAVGAAATNAGNQINQAFKGIDLSHLTKIHLSISQMTARLTEFYSIRSGLFAIGSEFTQAFHGLIQFNQELANTAAISNASAAQMEKLSAAALSIATSSKFSAAEVMKSMKTLAQAGVSAEDLPSVARVTDMFATGAGASIGDATKVLTTSMNVWNIQADKAGRISNTLTAALNNSKLEVGQLSTALNYLAGQSSLSGKSLEETTAIVATMANAGVSASTIGTGVSQLMSKLSAPGQKFKDLLKDFSISLEEISPRANSFASIIGKFEAAGIPAERIMAALEVRTGRSLAQAVNIGSQAFELMEQRIINTNAASVAYGKAMEGISSQINVLRSEALTSLNTTLQNTGLSFNVMKEDLQDLIVGLRSAEGQFLLFSTALAVGTATMTRAAMANPILASLTLALAGVTWGVSKFGEANREAAKDIDAATKKSADQAGEYQRKSDGLYTMLSLLDKNKTTEEGYLVVQDKSVKQIRAITNQFPELFQGLDLKKLKYSELTEIIRKYNQERSKELTNDISTGNQAADKINELKTSLAAANKAEDSSTSIWNFGQFQTARLTDQLKLATDAQEKMIAANLQARNDVEIYLDNQGTKRARKVVAPPDQPRGTAVEIPEKTHKVSSAKTPEERADLVLQRLGEEQKDISTKLVYQKAKIDRETAETVLHDKTLTAEEYAEKELKAISLLDKEYADKQVQEKTSAYTKLAKALEGAYTAPDTKHPSGLVTFDKRFNEDAVKMLIDQTNKNLNYQANVVDAAAKGKELEKIKQLQPVASPDKLTSFTVEKAADRELTVKNQTLALSEKLIWTETQLRQIQMDRTNAEISNATKKQTAYEKDLETLGERAKLTKDELAMYDAISTKLEGIKDKQIQLNALKREQAEGNQGAFTKGFRNSLLDKTDSNKITESFGSGLATAGIDGMTNSLTNMVTAINNGGNAWQAYSESLKKSMLDIVSQLQTYILKMMITYSVQKLIGLFAGGSEVATTANTNGVLQASAGYTWEPPKFAEGGPVLNGLGGGFVPLSAGIRGKVDSVPAYVNAGEFIVSRESTAAFGIERLQNINMQRFAEGGLVGGGSGMGGSKGSGGKQEFILQVVNVADVNSIPPQPVDAQQVINIVSFSAQQRGVMHKVIKGVLNS